MKPVVVGISGASGAVMARRTVDALLERRVSTALVITNNAKLVWQQELDTTFNECLTGWREDPNFTTFGLHEMAAPIASGTYPTAGMVIVPCSMTTVASLAHGVANNLMLRAADVCLKEKRRLVLVPRETPLHAVHLENMATLARLGAVVLPPEPPFYLRPRSVDDIVDFMIGRILMALGVEESLPPRHQYKGEGA